jgi:alanine-glyoxylate transaminase / serine-glyoxylate transaminase / serine-pyruvate transaminase
MPEVRDIAIATAAGVADGVAAALAGREERLMIPGPCQLDPREQEILAAPLEAHYGPRWAACMHQVLADLTGLLGADRTYLLPGSGSTALDAALFNMFEPGQRVVIVDSGYFGSRLQAMARLHGLEVRPARCEPGRPVDPDRVAELLPGSHGVVVTHVETATGVRHPVAQLAAMAAAADAVTVVDAVSAAGGERIDMKRMGVDALVTASQKGLAGAPGLGVLALTERGRQRVASRSRRSPSWYLDLATWDRAMQESPDIEPHPVTMPTSLVRVLASSVRRIRAVGIDTWVDGRERLARECRAGLRQLGMWLPTDDEYAANLVVVAVHPRAGAVRAHLADRAGIVVAEGLPPFADDALRVGLLGRTATRGMVAELLREIEAALR